MDHEAPLEDDEPVALAQDEEDGGDQEDGEEDVDGPVRRDAQAGFGDQAGAVAEREQVHVDGPHHEVPIDHRQNVVPDVGQAWQLRRVAEPRERGHPRH